MVEPTFAWWKLPNCFRSMAIFLAGQAGVSHGLALGVSLCARVKYEAVKNAATMPVKRAKATLILVTSIQA
jgi:hypothetical protein